MGSTEEPERKRRHLNHSSVSPTLKKQATLPSADEKKVDAAMLQYQNQKLEQQLDVQRSEISALESKCTQLKTKQSHHEDTLQSVRSTWGTMLEKVECLAARAAHSSKGNVSAGRALAIASSCSRDSAEAIFLERLLNTGATESSNNSTKTTSAEPTSNPCNIGNLQTVEHLVSAIDYQRARKEELFRMLKSKLLNDDARVPLQDVDESAKELGSLRASMDSLHLKHRDLAALARLWVKITVQDQAELKVVTGELEGTIVDLDSSRQKIAALRNEKDTTPGKPPPLVGVKRETSDSIKEKTFQDTKDLESAVEEAKRVDSLRLKELEDMQKEKACLIENRQKLQETSNGEELAAMSRTYITLSKQVEGLKEELAHYKSLMADSTLEQASVTRANGTIDEKADAYEALEDNRAMYEQNLSDLQLKLEDSLSERNRLTIRMDETLHMLDRQDEVAEFKVMVSTLEKEMGMMQQQLDKYKEAACGAESLRAEVESTSLSLESKINECKFHSDTIAEQLMEAKCLQDEARLLRESEQELKLILDMYGSESADSRDIEELKEAESCAWAEVEKMKTALDDHGLELRVRVAKEAEAACQQRLATAESEIFDCRQRLDASERVLMELKEAANMKSEERDAYLAEIETIGQAYEDMQTQNQRLLHQISKRDDYNIKLVSESVKSKQSYASLSEEKQGLLEYIQHASNIGDNHKQRVGRLEQQVQLHVEQLNRSTEEARKNARELEFLKRMLADAEKAYFSIKEPLDAAHKEVEQRKGKTAGIQAQLEKEKLAKRKIQEDLTSLKAKLARSSTQSDGSSTIEKLQDEVKEYKAILKCSVCHDRPKEVVITKCYHLFCNPCIQRNLEIRHRKCPGCGITFGQSDVRAVYI